ncbi:MAG: hypothetical protein IKT82_03605 [Bacteroidaceae bacterium]|nr:hypothetical protein [Bacteroidaceae bacterium]
MNKKLFRIPLLLLGVIVILIGLRFMPTITIFGYEVKAIDPLSDLFPSDSSELLVENLNLIPEVQQVVEEYKCPEGVTCIEDYSAGKPGGMDSFYKALEDREKLGRPVRIAYFGDSFIEGDILTADLRELLQQQYGGNGVGYLSIAPEAPGFRRSVDQSYRGWERHQAIDSVEFVSKRQSIAQTYAHPLGSCYTDVRATDKHKHAELFETSTFYVRSSQPLTFNVTMNDSIKKTVETKGTGKVEAVSVTGKMNHVRWTTSADRSVTGLGVAVEGKKGITLDNFALRSTSGSQLLNMDTTYLAEMSKVRPYDLIIIHYGLNVAGKNTTKYDFYVNSMSKVIERFKKAFPTTSILVVGVGDRETRIKGELHTMKGILALIQYQQQIAALNEVAFWNLYEAMGGDGSIVKLAEKKPAEARKDYTHITHEGGKTLADYYYKAILAGYEKYQHEKE